MNAVLPILLVSLLLLAGCAAKVDSLLANLVELAENGDADGQYRLGVRYTNGSGVRQDYATAAHWLDLAAAQGHPNAGYLLAIAYSTGRGVRVDQQRALKLFIRSAEAGHRRSQYQLGEAYANGRGAAKDPLWASRWYEKAARQKHPEALFSLGVFRAAGIDGGADPAQAWILLNLASDLGHPLAAEVRDRVAAGLSANALSRVKLQAVDWAGPNKMIFADLPTVRYAQRALNMLGYSAGPEDGLVGPATRAAILKFRRVRDAGDGSSIDPELVSMLRSTLLAEKSR